MIDKWGRTDRHDHLKTFMTVESVSPVIVQSELIITDQNADLLTKPHFSKLISLSDKRYVITSSETTVVSMLGRFWAIVLSIGFVVATMVTAYSKLHLQTTIEEFFPQNGYRSKQRDPFDRAIVAETRQKLVNKQEVNLDQSQL